MPSKKLKPLELKEDNKRYKARHESKKVKFEKCPHNKVEFKHGALVCPCGASWTGARLQELFDLLTKRK